MLTLLVGLICRLLPIVTEQVFFHFDSARDWLWIRDLVVNKKIPLVGPWSSLQGVFYGPLTYYLLAVFFWLFSGNPIGGSVYALIINFAALMITYQFLHRKFNDLTALIGLILLTFSPLSMYIATFIFQSNPSFILGAWLLWPLYYLSQGKITVLPELFLIAGLGVHVNLFWTLFVTGYIFSLILFLGLKMSWKIILFSLGALVLPILPQIIFEIRHQFLQTHALLDYITGNNHSLGRNLPLFLRLSDRGQLFFQIIKQSIGINNNFITGILIALIILTVILMIKSHRHHHLFLKTLIWLVVIFFGGATIFPAQFKIWYLYGLMPTFAVMAALILSQIFQNLKPARLIIIVFLIVFVLASLNQFWRSLNTDDFKRDLKIYHQQKEVAEKVIDWGGNETYAVYVYTEPIYDYPYQYLFWWLRQKTGKGPVAYSYLPQKYDYVLHKQLYDPPLSPFNTIFLIMEKDNPGSDYRWETWLKAFYEYEIETIIYLPSGVRIEKRIK